jgi:hypothetical protein
MKIKYYDTSCRIFLIRTSFFPLVVVVNIDGFEFMGFQSLGGKMSIGALHHVDVDQKLIYNHGGLIINEDERATNLVAGE